MSKTILLEIGIEELPSRFVAPAVEQLQQKAEKWLRDERITFQQVAVFATPRRLAVQIAGVAEVQADIREEVRGPAKKNAVDGNGNWTQAALGFARGQGISADQLYMQAQNGVEYVYATRESKGQPVKYLLAEGLKQLIVSLHFPKNMRWGNYEMRYARPIRWMVALFDSEVIEFSLAGVHSGRRTQGHRFLATETDILNAESYRELLRTQFVLVDMEERRTAIVRQIEQLAAEKKWKVPIDEDLLTEVTSLVEYPTVLFGQFSEEFLDIPQEVLITSMREHQRYFPVLDEQGKMQPYFITIRNGDDRSLAQVAKGNEKVLRARLADARFFYLEDQKLSIDRALAKLEKIVYQEELGTIADKVRRIVNNAIQLCDLLHVERADRELVKRAAEICKFDLVTQMVYEFPELQGVMGEDYARKQNEHSSVARAVKEHYQPRFSGDQSPSDIIATIVSIADKIDTMIGCFSLGFIPTGSQDPYALRRQSAGIVQMIADHGLSCNISQLVEIAVNSYGERRPQKTDQQKLTTDVLEFFSLRIKNALSEADVRYDVIDAVMAVGIDDIRSVLTRGKSLMACVVDESFKPVVEALTRVVNISSKQPLIIGTIDATYFQHESEQRLHDAWLQTERELAIAVESTDGTRMLAALAALEAPIANFFTNVMVMADDVRVRENRLLLLQSIAHIIQSFADFGKLVR